MWSPISYVELGESVPDVSYDPHTPKHWKSPKLPWAYCSKCGLVYLKNDATAKAIRLGCNWKDIERKKR